MACNAGYGWCKGEDIVHRDGDKEYCVFHAPADKKGITVEEFNDIVHARLNLCLEKNEKCDMRRTIFPGDISFKGMMLPEVSFYNATFSGKAFFGSHLLNTVMFRDAFPEFFQLIPLTFKFGGLKNIVRRTTFNGDADFGLATFRCNTIFYNASFGGKADFSEATFKSAIFAEVTFPKSSSVLFKNSTFHEGITFTNVRMPFPALMGCDLDKFKFTACEWETKGGRNILGDEQDLLEDEKAYYGSGIPGWLKRKIISPFVFFDTLKIGAVEDLYRKLKIKYKDMHDDEEVSKFHESEKEMKLKGMSIKEHPFMKLVLSFYRLASGFGENPLKAFTVLASLILLAFLSLGSIGFAQVDAKEAVIGLHNLTWESFKDLLASTLTHLTFQKDHLFRPATSTGRIVLTFFIVAIPLQTALFAMALRNRLRR